MTLPRLFPSLIGLALVIATPWIALAQRGDGMTMSAPAPDSMGSNPMRVTSSTMVDEMDMLHPFFTHMGLPDPVGHFALRLSGVDALQDGNSFGDFGLHLEAGILPRIGLHIRNDRIVSNAHTEITVQYAMIQSEDKMKGFAPFVELEVATNKEESHNYGLVGFSTMWTEPIIEFNQSIEYSPAESGLEGSVSAMLRAGYGFFPVVEFVLETAKNVTPANSLIAGIKYRLNKVAALGIAYQAPVTDSRTYSHQLLLQSDIEW